MGKTEKWPLYPYKPFNSDFLVEICTLSFPN